MLLPEHVSRVALVVHGGAGEIRDSSFEERRIGVGEALAAGWNILRKGGAALDACHDAVLRLEDAVVFNAGVGSRLNRDGEVELDAAVMDGARVDAGAVAAVRRIRNPVSLARHVMERSEHVFLVGAGAEEFALSEGHTLCEPSELVTERERFRWLAWKEGSRTDSPSSGTVGAVAIYRVGDLAVAISIGGTPGKHPGRVGDSPVLGCGCYADNRLGAASATGDGEAILRVGLSREVLERIAAGLEPQQAAQAALESMKKRTSGTAGLILLDKRGRIGIAHTTPHMSAGWVDSRSGDIRVFTEYPK